jgi:salicylate hydroxylase
MGRALKVAVVGAGMGGLSLGCALRARGIEVEIYDQAGELSQVGAGIQLTPNATKALRGLGLEHRLKEFGFLPKGTVGRDWRTGRTVFRTPLQGACEPLYHASYVHIHRADLQRMLFEALPEGLVRLSNRCVGVRNEPRSAVARFADGSEVEADLVVAADGIKSAVRAALFGDGAPRFTGNMCWRSVVPLGAPDFDLVSPDNSIWFGPHGHIVTYYVNGGAAVNIVAVRETDTWLDESWTVRSSKEELAAAYPGWHEKLHRLFERASEVYKWGLFDRDPMTSWTAGRVTLLGDAAHPMLPYLSQGAAMAMEDSLVLGRMLAEPAHDVAEALALYEAIRIPRTTRVLLTSRAQGSKNHLASPWARLRRDIAYRIRNLINPQSTGLKAGWVYEYDAATAVAENDLLVMER